MRGVYLSFEDFKGRVRFIENLKKLGVVIIPKKKLKIIAYSLIVVGSVGVIFPLPVGIPLILSGLFMLGLTKDKVMQKIKFLVYIMKNKIKNKIKRLRE